MDIPKLEYCKVDEIELILSKPLHLQEFFLYAVYEIHIVQIELEVGR